MTRDVIPTVAGVLTAAEVAATVDTIAAVQLPTGMIPWFPGGHADPWNHVEAAMALALGGRRARPSGPTSGSADRSGPTAPGTSTTWPTASRRPSSTPTCAPTWPPACGTTGC